MCSPRLPADPWLVVPKFLLHELHVFLPDIFFTIQSTQDQSDSVPFPQNFSSNRRFFIIQISEIIVE